MIPLIIFLFAYVGFGIFLLDKLKIKFSVLERLVIGTVISISGITSCIALLGQLMGSRSYYFLLIPFFLGVSQYKKLLDISKKVLQLVAQNKLLSIFAITCLAILMSTIGLSRKLGSGNYLLQEVHDSVWHIALIQNLQISIPPVHPSDPTVMLNNYHYFYDLFLASFAYFSQTSLFTLYYQYSVVFLASLLILSAYILGKKINGTLSGVYLVAFTTFVGSFAYLIPYFNPGQMWHESSFWVSQTLVMMVNPQIIYTLALSYIFILLLHITNKFKPSNPEYFQLHAILILISATSIGFKSYAWVILSFIYGIFLLAEIIKYKKIQSIFIGIFYLIFSVPFVWLITHFKGNSFFYQPLWFTNTMIEGADRVNYLEWKFLQDHYIFKKNWIRLFILEAKKIAIFYFGNLGVRSFFIFLPIVLYLRKKIAFRMTTLYVFTGFLFSSIFPLLFLQRGTVWNSIQFWYYALIFANILVVIALSEFLKKQFKILILVVSLLLLGLAVPTSIKTILDKNKSPFIADATEIEFLQSLTPIDTVLICPEGSNLYHSAMVKVITPAQVYLANPSQLELVGSATQKAEDYEAIFSTKQTEEFSQLIAENHITTIICKDSHLTTLISEMLQIQNTTIANLHIFKL